MANNLLTLRSQLDTQLSDTNHAAWSQAEKEQLIIESVEALYPRFGRPISAPIWPVDPDTEDYTLPVGMLEVSQVDIGEVATDTLIDNMPVGTWRVYGDPAAGTGVLHINRHFLYDDRYLILHGIGRYDFGSNLIPDYLVPLVLSYARAEAYRRMLGERARFKQWATSNQTQNVSINELLGMVEEAERKVAELRQRQPRTWRLPVPGRV